jgi:cytochrome c oxidase subunit 3
LPNGLAAHADEHLHAHHPAQQHHFETLQQQAEASNLGMWLFLVTEVMFFGGLFTAYLIYRLWYPEAWAEGSRALNIYQGGGNTMVLIASSLTMAMAVRNAQTGRRKATVVQLLLTMALGLTFLVVKYFEYKYKFDVGEVPGPNFHFEGLHAAQAEIFFSLYFAITGLHALHMIIGLGLMSVMTWMAWKGRFSPEWYTPMEMSGLYWHFVDIVWIFLFPLLYLVDRAGHFA